MNTVSPAARLHRMLGVAAVIHAALLLATVSYIMGEASEWPVRLWVGFTTLWFLWPIILAFHIGRSARRAYVPVAVAAATLALPMYAYLRLLAPQVFFPNEMLSLSPYDVGAFTTGYIRGWIAAKQRARAEVILLEGYGMGGGFTPAAPPFSAEVLAKYRLEIQPIASCVVNPYIQGHARGYNTAAVAQITDRYGPQVITAAEQEEAARQQRYAEMKDSGRAAAGDDARVGRLAYLLYQPPRGGEEEYRELFREYYQIELRRVAEAYSELDDDRQAYVNGYNEAASDEIARRFGERVRQDLWGVDYRPVEEFRGAVAAAGSKPAATHDQH